MSVYGTAIYGTSEYGDEGVVYAEELTLDGLELHASPFTVEGFEHKPAKKLLEWVKGADADGSKLLRVARHENAEVTFRLRVDKQATMDEALDAIGLVVDKVQEAERQAAGALGRGLELVWSPAGSTFTGTFYVLAGEVEVPKTTSGEDVGYLWRMPVINITLSCDPFIYGEEVVNAATVTSSLPLITLEVPDVPGDVPAEATFRLTDAAGQSRDFVAIGLENFYYDSASPAPLLIDSDSFVTSGFAGSQTTRTGAYDVGGGNTVVRATLTTTAVAVCSSAELAHLGTFHNYFRLWPSSTDVMVRLAWRQGRDQWTTELWRQAPFEDAWWEVELGLSKIRAAQLGTQTWQWRLEAKSSAVGETIDADFHAMIPAADGYGKVRRIPSFDTPVTFSARDEFNQSAGALIGKTAPVGGTWAGAGVALSVNATDDVAERTGSSAGGGWAHLDSVSLTDTLVQCDVKLSSTSAAIGVGIQARRVASNYVEARLLGDGSLHLQGEVPSSLTFATGQIRVVANSWYTIRLLIVGGMMYLWAFPRNGQPGQPAATAYSSDVAALAAGSVGLTTLESGTSTTRQWDNLLAAAPTADAAIFASQSGEFRAYGDATYLREDSSGTYWGEASERRGGRLWLPCEGDQGRTSRVALMARRTDVETTASANVTDSTTLTVSRTPRWLTIPRQP